MVSEDIIAFVFYEPLILVEGGVMLQGRSSMIPEEAIQEVDWETNTLWFTKGCTVKDLRERWMVQWCSFFSFEIPTHKVQNILVRYV